MFGSELSTQRLFQTRMYNRQYSDENYQRKGINKITPQNFKNCHKSPDYQHTTKERHQLYYPSLISTQV